MAVATEFGYADGFAVGPYRVYFYSHDLIEPPHVHVDRDDLSAKFWLDPVSLARNLGFKPKELRTIERLLVDHEVALLKTWQEQSDQES
jgi:hypothetical protein